MKFKDYYDTLGVPRGATQDEIKQAYRKLARKHHPDLSKASDAEARFKELGEANEVLKDPEKRAAYDRMGAKYKAGQDIDPPPGWDGGFGGFDGRDNRDNRDNSDFFEAMFGPRARSGRRPNQPMAGQDQHAKVLIDLDDTFEGASRSITLRMPVGDGSGRVQERRLDVSIPKGIREGQQLRLAGQGGPGSGGAPAGDLLLEIGFNPHPRFRVDGRDLYFDLALAPWEAALGATVDVATPGGTVQLGIPPGSAAGRKLRLKGRGLPSRPAGDLYAVLTIQLPPAETDSDREAYQAFAAHFDFNPRAAV